MSEFLDDAMQRRIARDERSGVLFPERLVRYSAGWIAPDADVSAVVDQYWHVSWTLDDEEVIDQRVIDLPAITLTIEAGNVPAPMVVTGVHSGAWRRAISGSGDVFAIRLRPAGLAVLSDLTPAAVADASVPLTPQLDQRLHSLLGSVAAETAAPGRARAADAAIRRLLDERAPTQAGLLANAILNELRERWPHRTGRDLALHFHRSERAIQRALAETLAHGPKWVSRRIRLQQVALSLASRPADDVAAIAADLGYSDESHLIRDFRAVSGIAPAAYRRSMQRLLTE